MPYVYITIAVLVLGLIYHFYEQNKEFKRVINAIAKAPITMVVLLWAVLFGDDNKGD